MDLGSTGPPFTWIKQINNQLVKVRLDKRVANTQWRRLYPKTIIENQIPIGSNYAPIILTLEPKDKFLPRPFRFEWIWTQDERCKEEIENEWNKPFNGTKWNKIKRNLKTLPKALRKWNKEIFGNINEQIKIKRKMLENLHN